MENVSAGLEEEEEDLPTGFSGSRLTGSLVGLPCTTPMLVPDEIDPALDHHGTEPMPVHEIELSREDLEMGMPRRRSDTCWWMIYSTFGYLRNWLSWSNYLLSPRLPTLDQITGPFQGLEETSVKMWPLTEWKKRFPNVEFDMDKFIEDRHKETDVFIVTLVQGCDAADHIQRMKTLNLSSNLPNMFYLVGHRFKNINAYSVRLNKLAIYAIAMSGGVENITQNRHGVLATAERLQGALASTLISHGSIGILDSYIIASDYRANTPWGLQRVFSRKALSVSSDPLALSHIAQKGPVSHTIKPVDVYVIDSGVHIDHSDFGGRAEWGKVFAGKRKDEIGHGTHIAATIAGSWYGSSGNARIIAVKTVTMSVDGFKGSQLVDDLKAFDWVIDEARLSKRPSVINFSIVYSPCCSVLEKLVESATEAGVTVCAAAGNGTLDHDSQRLHGVNAEYCSPGRLTKVITVAASDIKDRICDFSNYGTAIKITAPGDQIISAGITGRFSTAQDSGTSFATAHVTGVVANILSYRHFSPKQILWLLQLTGTQGQ